MWFERMQQNDDKGLRALFDAYYTVLCRYALTITDNEMASEDVVQGVFIYLWENRQQITITTTVKNYLFAATRNKALNYLRDSSPFSPLPETETLVYEDLSVETDELFRLIEEAIQILPEKCRNIFILSRKEELSYEEIALQKGISAKTVEAQIHIAIKRLRKYLTLHYKE